MAVINICATDFKKAVSGLMSEDDADALFEEARSAALARWQKRLMPKSEALNKSFEELIAEREVKQRRARLQSLQNVVKYHGAIKQIKQFKTLSRGLLAFLGGVESNIPNSRVSVVNQMISDERAMKSYYLGDLEKHGLEKLFNSKGIDDELGNELENPGSSKNPQIKKLAEVTKKHQKAVVKSLNEQGADIQTVDNYIAKLKHNAGRMMSATGFGLKDAKLRATLLFKNKGDFKAANAEFKEVAFNRWKNSVEPLTDKDTFRKIAKEDEGQFYRSFYNSVTTGIHKVPALEGTSAASGANPLISRIGSNIANKLSAERILHFNEGGWVKYNKQYGYDTIHDAIVKQFDEAGKSLGLMKKSGTSPRTFLARLHRAIQEEGETRQEPGFNKNMKRAKNLIDTIVGDNDRPMEGLAGQMFRSFRLSQYLSKTGSIMLSSIPDLGIMTSALRQHGIPAATVYSEALKNLAKGIPKGELKQLALQLRIYSDGTLGSLMSKFGSTDTLYGNFAKMMKIQDKLSGINRWDNTTRYTMGYLLSKKLASVIDTDFDKLIPSQKRTLEISGMNEKMWRLMQANKDSFNTIQNMKFITPDIVDDFTDESIARIYHGNATGKTTELKLKQARDETKEALGIFFTDQTAYGKILPTASDRSLMHGGAKANTFAGQVWRMITMFHSFHVASTRRTLGRFLYGNGAEDLYDALIRGKADFKGMGQYMLQTLPLGYVSYASKLMAVGLEPPPLNDKKTWAEAAQRGGMFFIYGAYFADAFNSQHDFLSSLSGPGIKTVADTIGLINKIISGKNPANAALWLAQGNIPFINLFYLKAAMDHALLNGIHNKIDPTYTYKKIQRAKKNNQRYLWVPH